MAQDEKKPTAAEKGKGKATEEDVTMANGDDKTKTDKDGKAIENGKPGDLPEEDLSEEDQQLKTDLEMLVERLKENDSSLYQPSIDQIKTFIKTSTSSMTAVLVCYAANDTWFGPDQLKEMKKQLPSLQVSQSCSFGNDYIRIQSWYLI